MEDVTDFFARYAEHYMESDVDAISALYEAPFLAVRDGSAIHLSDRKAVRDHLAQLMDEYQRAGAKRADIAGVDVVALGKSSQNVTVHWHVTGASGEVLKDFRTTYQLLRDGTGWRILSYANHD